MRLVFTCQHLKNAQEIDMIHVIFPLKHKWTETEILIND